MSGFVKAIKKFPKTFWTANCMEIMERWAWYGLFGVLAVYLTGSTDDGGLGFTQAQKGSIMGVVTALLYLLPMITGAIGDRFGYKKILLISYVLLSSGYFMMGEFTTYGSVFFAFVYVALGAALFKPVISATIAKTTDKETSSIGFGIFYMMVNVGGFIGPFCASILRGNLGFNWVFWMASAAISINFFLLLIFYKDPSLKEGEKDNVTNIKDYFLILFIFFTSVLIFITCFSVFLAVYILETPFTLIIKGYKRNCYKVAEMFKNLPIGESNKKIFDNITTIFRDPNFVIFLTLIIGFWTMFNQIFYTLPNFIEQWADTTPLYGVASAILQPALTEKIFGAEGVIKPEMLINLDALMIVFFQIMISTLVMKWKPLNAMISGMIVCSLGVGFAFMTANVWCIVIGIAMFAFGEMSSSPKITEYIGRIAPKDKVGLYMGCSFLPVAGGNLITGYLSGPVYQSISDKLTLLKTEVATRGLSIPEISKTFTQNNYFDKAGELMGFSQTELTQFLWNNYNPSRIWMLFTGIGIGAAILLFLYDRFLLSKKPMGANVEEDKSNNEN